MPDPKQVAQVPPHIAEMVAKIPLRGESSLVHEIQELRQEIAALRADLIPTQSAIAMGREVLAEFRALRNQGGAAT